MPDEDASKPEMEIIVRSGGSDLVVLGLLARNGEKYDVVAGYFSKPVLLATAVLFRELARTIESEDWSTIDLELVSGVTPEPPIEGLEDIPF